MTNVVTEISHYEVYYFIKDFPSVAVIPSPVLWEKMGEAKAMFSSSTKIPVPMTCSITNVNTFLNNI